MFEMQTRPYVLRVQRAYETRVEPYVIPVRRFVHDCFRALEPYVSQVIAFLQQQWYRNVSPHLTPLWERVTDISSRWFFTNVYDPAGDLRRKYVDKHVGKMVKKFEEMSDGKPSKVVEEDETVIISAETPSPATIFAKAQILHDAHGSPSDDVDTVDDPAPEPILSQAAPAAEETSHESARAQEPVVVLMPGPVIPSDASVNVDEDDDLSVIAFLSSLTAEPIATVTTEEPISEPTQKTHEEIAAETAKRRAEITARTVEWEAKLAAEGATQIKKFKETLLGIRTRAAEEVKSDSGAFRADVQGLQEQSDKSMIGIDKFVHNLVRKKTGSDEKVALFENVVEKVREKFSEFAIGVNERVQDWWLEVLIEEDQEVCCFFSIPLEGTR